jgi:hypothetical protein
MIYIPKPYRPRLFPRIVRWCLIAAACMAVVWLIVLLMWELDAFMHYSLP